MRTVADLTKDQRRRLRQYVERNMDESSRQLSEDLQVERLTIIAWKAWGTRSELSPQRRSLANKFNQLLSGTK